MKGLIIVLLVFFLVGCATVGKPIHQVQVDKIQKGKTTKQEIIQIFGQPDGTYFDKDGQLIFYYTASKIRSSGWNFVPLVNIIHSEMNMQNQMLTIIFSKEGVVEEYSFTDSNKPIKSGIIP